MGSSFGWVDFAEEDRQKMLDLIHRFREQDTRDELGIGTIRDSFSDYFFPGTSTIQTKIRYMLFIPWIYIHLEKTKVPSANIAARARSEEIRLIFSLLHGGEKEGVIGSDVKKNLKRLPSSIYWSGLGSWGIRLFRGSQDQYHRSIDKFYLRQKTGYEKEVDEEFQPTAKIPNWHPGLPDAPGNWMKELSLDLTPEEATYLKDRILNRQPESLLAAFIRKGKTSKARFPWEHPTVNNLPSRLKGDIIHARNFSEVLFGAPLLYNLMLAEEIKKESLVEEYIERLSKWADGLTSKEGELSYWFTNIDNFWNSDVLKDAQIPIATKKFVNCWLDFVFLSPGLNKLIHHHSVRSEIKSREVSLKRNRARLTNKQALKRWQGDSGTSQLSYRWATASTFITDILKGLKGGGKVA